LLLAEKKYFDGRARSLLMHFEILEAMDLCWFSSLQLNMCREWQNVHVNVFIFSELTVISFLCTWYKIWLQVAHWSIPKAIKIPLHQYYRTLLLAVSFWGSVRVEL
jgi:hypothetical protein